MNNNKREVFIGRAVYSVYAIILVVIITTIFDKLVEQQDVYGLTNLELLKEWWYLLLFQAVCIRSLVRVAILIK